MSIIRLKSGVALASCNVHLDYILACRMKGQLEELDIL